MKVAVVGATGAVGRVLLSILEERRFPVTELRAFASSRSAGKRLTFRGEEILVRTLSKPELEGLDFAFFDASDAVSAEWVPEAARAGAWVIDNSGAFRMEPDVPLVVPEVNGHVLSARLMRKGSLAARERVFAGPNCSTVQLSLPLQALHARWGLRRVVVSTYQSVSGAGALAIQELKAQLQARLQGQDPVRSVFPREIAFNTIPQIGSFKSEGDSSEESKIIEESRKILGIPNLRITATAVRVPTLHSHSESVNVELDRPFELTEVREALSTFPGLKLVDDLARGEYPTGLDAAHRDPVWVGRVRRDASLEHGLNFWVVSDNLRKGAALNAIQIAETLLR